jgi:UDPglucose 6-dehydrogenase
MRIAMIGAGYVGLVSSACFADFGHQVCCVDRDEARVTSLIAGKMPIYEPGLDDLVSAGVRVGRLRFTTTLAQAVAEADVVFIAVGTPSRRGDGHADLTFVYSAAHEIAASLTGFTVVATKSTVPVGTGDEIERIIRETNPDADAVVVSNPEFLREGAAIEDFKHPDRIVIGVDDARGRKLMQEIYRPLNLNQAPLMFTDRRSAELAKYAANAFLAMKVTFVNEIADLCETVQADVQSVARAVGLDRRIGSKFLHAGPGFGGSCFPKDTRALVKIAHDSGSALRLVEATIAINDQRKRTIARKVISACAESVRGKTIGVLGLTFKPNTDDTREASSLSVIQALQDAGARIQAYDPKGMKAAEVLLKEVTLCPTPYGAALDAAALVIVTEWNEFRALDFPKLRSVMAPEPALVDLRNIYDPRVVAQHGFRYFGVGRGRLPSLDFDEA